MGSEACDCVGIDVARCPSQVPNIKKTSLHRQISVAEAADLDNPSRDQPLLNDIYTFINGYCYSEYNRGSRVAEARIDRTGRRLHCRAMYWRGA
jgi:hypothetical protein